MSLDDIEKTGPKNYEAKKFSLTPSGRRSIVRGAKYQRGLTFDPREILCLFHDTHPELPIPKDAQHKGLGVHDSGSNSVIEFYFTSELAPSEFCFAMKPELFFKLIKDLAEGMIPTDAELDGIELSPRWVYVMLRISSSHWPVVPSGSNLPMAHLRYDFGQLRLVDMSQVLKPKETKIRIQ